MKMSHVLVGLDSKREAYHTTGMSKRLQVVVDDGELAEIQRAASARSLTVAEWVWQALRKERREAPLLRAESKIRCVREAASHSDPVGEIGEMLHEIERGRSEVLP